MHRKKKKTLVNEQSKVFSLLAGQALDVNKRSRMLIKEVCSLFVFYALFSGCLPSLLCSSASFFTYLHFLFVLGFTGLAQYSLSS